MPSEQSSETKFEIGHVLFLDIVGYSKLLIEEQKERLTQLIDIVLATAAVREATDEQLVRLPTGDGMALVFRRSVEEPARCALEIADALRKHPELPLRMGIHSGPVSEVTDVSGRTNIAGPGINMAQRVMDCGDAGHILVSQRVADDLGQYRQWAPRLHDLGDCEVKHGVKLHLVNLYAEPIGNAAIPQKLQQAARKPVVEQLAPRMPARRSSPAWIAALLLIAVLATAAVYFFSTRRPALPAAPVPAKSIAVLPFANLSKDEENAFFADGVQNQILTSLAKIADLKVISRTSVMQYKTGARRNLRDIGQQLGVAYLLEGSVQRAANKVRVNAQLIDSRSDTHQWAENYDRDLADVFAIQSEIATKIADQLRAKISPSEKAEIERAPTKDTVAFDLYTKANALIFSTSFSTDVRERLLEAIDLLNQAIARDPSFFLAYCQLGLASADLYEFNYDHTPARLEVADAAVKNALRLRPDAGETHLARAQQLYECYLDYDAALKELEIAGKTLPNDPRVSEFKGYIFRRRGQLDEGLAYLQRSLDLDPRNLYTLQQISLSYFQLRRYREVAEALDRALSINPDDVDVRVTRASVDLNWKADPQPLAQAIADTRAKNPAAIKSVADFAFMCAISKRDAAAAQDALNNLGENTLGDDAIRLPRNFGLGVIARMQGDAAKAQAAFAAARTAQEKEIAKQPEYGPAWCVLSVIDAGLGRKKEALEEGKRALELTPTEKDLLNGAHIHQYFAIAAAWVGEKDLAFQHLQRAIDNWAIGPTSYGQLKLLPYWDPLRGDPRFEKIVANLAPK